MEIPAIVGFTTGSNLLKPGNAKKPTLVPSAEALAKAAEIMKRWQSEMDDDFSDSDDPEHDLEYPDMPTHTLPSFQPILRPVLGTMENSFAERQPPSTPSPVGGGLQSLSPLSRRRVPGNKNSFKSPLMSTPATRARGSTSYVASPLNPTRAKEHIMPATPVRRSPPSTPVRPMAMSPPKKTLGVTPRRVVSGGSVKKPAFSTPFKTGMRPGELGRVHLDAVRFAAPPGESSSSAVVNSLMIGSTSHTTSPSKGKGKTRAIYFDLCGYANLCVYSAHSYLPSSKAEQPTCSGYMRLDTPDIHRGRAGVHGHVS